MSEIQGIAPPDTSPEKSIPLPTPPSIPSLQTLRDWLPLYLQKTDRSLERLSTIISTPSGTDTALLTLCYTSLLASSVISSISLHRLHRSATDLIARITALPPNTTVIIDTSSIPPSRLLITAKRLKALSSLISDFRIFARLWGLLGIYKWGKRTVADPPEDDVVRRIVYTQVLVNIFFQCLENGAYLSSKGVMGWTSEKQNRAWIWSSRFWMAHVGLDFLRLGRVLMLRRHRGTEEQKRVDGPKGDVITERGEQEWRAAWAKEVIVNAAWAPLTLHWSLEKGLIGDFWVGVLGSVAGLSGLGTLWRKSGEM
ncbi:hypothetical protein D0Z07_4730 [Hyphodiscus hymeniophilus]|uniref:Peroxin 11C n=1 Tax=Hyphodiscus hymeniophilus TaxID=353542 RepID=A0A9P7AWI4_9HELO|nr:hypothetical protein D0Z07_4730 [Hyphodiscus hymeniophilus]